MRLAVDATSLLTPRTGIGVFTSEMLRALAGRPDMQVSAFNTSPRGRGRGWLPSDIGDGVHEVPGRMPTGGVRWLWDSLSVPRLEWFAGRADVVHGPNYRVPPTSRAAPVVSVHDVSFEHGAPIGGPAGRAHGRSVRAAVRAGAWIHTDSEYVAAEVRDIYRVEPHRVVAVPLGVRLPPPGPHPAPGSEYVLALGSADRRKGLTTLVAAFDALASTNRDLRLVHAGPDGDASGELADLIDRSPHRDRILRLGWVDDGARSALIAQAAAVAYPSLYEGFGLVVLEAMAAGRPVVTTPVAAIPEVAGDAASYVEAGDADALAGALQRVLEDQELAAELGTRGRSRAAGFTWERTVDGLIDVYRLATEAA
ncbi:MAG: glycosyltransferase family 4 protein [Acidimicrobiaceae bacterium]|nr:glycosyltransferase family 4 protein [Acidimicrobiaceae bacterium]MYH00125.1 glycosyltransferase family 4 protein [Acidimicrobiaceae bacterium]